uniref:START domain-containing protein n=2 Tax=Hemiselmis andersenii TaxID=464988 RepID=A0A7S1EMH3_HEMAN
MARAVIDASPEDIFKMFGRNDLVPEYNEYCQELEDIVVLDADTKVTWGATGRVGPFAPRDFVTRCHTTVMEDGTHLAANLAESLSHLAEGCRNNGKSGTYCRMEVLIGGTIARPIEGGAKSEYTILCLTNPGGAADTPIGSALMNKVAATGPIVHINQIRKMVASKRWTKPLPGQ